MTIKRSYFRKILKIIIGIFLSLILLFIIIILLIQLPFIQNKIVDYASTFISQKTGAKFEVGNVSVRLPKSVVVRNLYLEDLQQDTLLYAGKIRLNPGIRELITGKFRVKNFVLEDVNLQIQRFQGDTLFNFNFLITSFTDNKNAQEKEPTDKPEITLIVDNVLLQNMRFFYNDEYGGTYVNSSLGRLELKMEEISLAEAFYSIDELLIDDLAGSIMMNKAKDDDSGDGMLPDIRANKILITNSEISFQDSIKQQYIHAELDMLELTDIAAGLPEENISAGIVFLANSKFEYHSDINGMQADTVVEDAKSKNEWIIQAERIELNDNSLSYISGKETGPENSFDPQHLEYRKISLTLNNLYYSSLETKASIKNFSAIDRNNFAITRFETDFSMNNHSIQAHGLKAETVHSSIHASLNLNFPSLSSLRDSLELLTVEMDIGKVSIRNSDILFFSPELSDKPFFKESANRTELSGFVHGRMNDLKGVNLLVKTADRTVLSTGFVIKGLPEFRTAYFQFTDLNLISGKQDIQKLAASLIPETISLPELIHLQGTFDGTQKEFESYLTLNTSYGNAEIYAEIAHDENFTSRVSINAFDLGRLLNDSLMFGPVTLEAEIEGHGLEIEKLYADISLNSQDFYLNSYTYNNLQVDGNISGQIFEGEVHLFDENVVLDMNALVNLRPGEEGYQFQLELQGADLYQLQLTTDDIRIGFSANADLKGSSVADLNGSAVIYDFLIARDDEIIGLDSLLFAVLNEEGNSEISFTSEPVSIKYSGSSPPNLIPGGLGQFVNNYFNFSDEEHIAEQENIDFEFEVHLRNHPVLSQILLPDLKEFEPGTIEGHFISKTNDLKINASIHKMVYGASEIHDLNLSLDSDTDSINYELSISNISGNLFNIDNFLFDGRIKNNTISAGLFSADNDENVMFSIYSELTKPDENFRLVLDTENFILMQNRWEIDPDNYITFGGEGFLIHRLFFSDDESRLNIASVNERFNDDLQIEIRNFELADISRIIEKEDSMMSGSVDGNILVKKLDNEPVIIADAEINNMILFGIPVGNLSLKADNPNEGQIDLEITLSGAGNHITAMGYLTSAGEENFLNVKTDIQSLSMQTIEAFSMGQVSETAGFLSGEIIIQGETGAPDITGEIVFNEVFVTPGVLNNRLEIVQETVSLKSDGIYFNSFTIRDANRQSATINGVVNMTSFSDLKLGLEVSADNFLLMNTTVNDNEVLYGRIVIDSRININGPLTLPVVSGNIKLKEGSYLSFMIPESRLTTDRGEGVVEFESPDELYPILYRGSEETAKQTEFSGFDLTTVIEIDRQVTLRMLMDPSSPDSLVIRGEAALSLAMDRSGRINLTGTYNIMEGSYLVSFETFVKRRFEIDPGSSITWSGDPLDAEITLNAKHTVRTAPYNLVADQISAMSEAEKATYRQQYDFNVLLKLRGKISQPLIGFEIQLPAENQGILGGSVNQKLILLNEDASALNKQVFALLILGRFVQENPLLAESGGTAALIRSTVSNFLSAQLNRMASQVLPGTEIKFDVRSYEDYQTGMAEGRTEVGIGIQQQLFNERLTVKLGGSFDVEGERASENSASEITGDVMVEYSLSEDGRLRLKGFRHNQYEGAIEGQLVETGVGLVFVRDFNEWRELFRNTNK